MLLLIGAGFFKGPFTKVGAMCPCADAFFVCRVPKHSPTGFYSHRHMVVMPLLMQLGPFQGVDRTSCGQVNG